MSEPCAELVYDSLRWGSFPCKRKGVVERAGKWYCKQHDPQAVERRKEEAQKRSEEKWINSPQMLLKAEREAHEKTRQLLAQAVELLRDIPPDRSDVARFLNWHNRKNTFLAQLDIAAIKEPNHE